MERCKFVNTWETLLGLVGEDSGTTGTPPWSPSLEARLLAHLRSSAVTAFVDACEHLKRILQGLNERLEGYEKDRVSDLDIMRPPE